MGGEIKVLEFSEGIDTLSPPSGVFISTTSATTFVNDAAYVAAKGSAAVLGDMYTNSTLNKVRFFDGSTWNSLHDQLYNLTAVLAPTNNDDSADGYEIGSQWINTATGEWYIANDVSVGAAVWKGMVDLSTAQTITGQKSFSAITNFTNATESNDKDTGAVVVEGGVGIEKNLNVGGNAVINGDLTVQGTTTTLNTSTLDVEDANISINKNGNKASADNIAGIRVEMSDNTHGSLKYVSTLASRFKIGDLASESEVMTVTAAQNIINKNYYDNTNVFVDSDDVGRIAKFDCGSITTANTRTFIFPDSNGTFALIALAQLLTNKSLDDSTTLFQNTAITTKKARIETGSITAGQTRVITVPDTDLTLVGTSIAQTLTNKTLDGGTASTQNLWKLPGDSLVNLTALARVEKAIYYDETNNRIVYDDGATLNPVGSGGGAGGGMALVWRNDDSYAADEKTMFNQFAYEFTPYEAAAGNIQKVFSSIKVPTGYTAGKQISVKLKVFSPTGSNNILLTGVSTLINAGSSSLADTTNQRTSTNAAQAIAAANKEYEITLDITSATGQINGVSLAPGDTVLFYVTRGTDTNTDYAYFMPSTAEVYIAP